MERVRFRIDLKEGCSVGPGKISLLEAIARLGSLRKAASELGMSYRRAWLLVDSLNRSFTERSTTASVGGVGGGGIALTAFGIDLVRRYRAAAQRIESLAHQEFAPLARKVVDADRPLGARRRISRLARP